PRPPPRRPAISTGHIQPCSVLNPVIRLSLQLKICPHRCTAGRSPNHLLRGNTSYYPTGPDYPQRQLLPKHRKHRTRAPLTLFLILAPSNNMIHFHPSRNQPMGIEPTQKGSKPFILPLYYFLVRSAKKAIGPIPRK
uniref:Uncharacterized protein n=1 Tax=Athene cunicularia TaxID=194338 RepID=A0A663MT45_ATHCN